MGEPAPELKPEAAGAADGVVADDIFGGKGLGTVVDFGPTVGYIRWFPQSSRFEAVCTRNDHTGNHKEARCRQTRYCTESRLEGDKFNAAAGRPLGLLSAFLLGSFDGLAHEHGSFWHVLTLTRAQRIDGRRTLKLLENGPLIISFERTQRSGEESEPEGDP